MGYLVGFGHESIVYELGFNQEALGVSTVQFSELDI